MDGKRRSFRDEAMANRRVFLRSYPLLWEEEEEREGREEGESERVSQSIKRYWKAKSLLKGSCSTLLQWGEEKLQLLRKAKKDVAFYIFACNPFGFKSQTKFLGA